jgi:hypothetical protein
MAQYVQATNFASKDALLSGDPNKIVKGTEINDEFTAIQTAVNSKADALSPTLTGTPLAPTATAGTVSTQIATTAFVDTAVTNGITTERTAAATLTNKALTDAVANTQSFGDSSTKLATTAFVQAALQAVYPVGSVYVSTTATNPATTFGFGTWAAFGAGKVLVGQDTGDTSFDTLEETGGSKNSIVVSHSHSVSSSGSTSSAGSHGHTINDPGHVHGISDGAQDGFDPGTGQYRALGSASISSTTSTTGISINSNGDHTHTVSTSGTAATTGSSGTNANLQPYVVVKMWKRTA